MLPEITGIVVTFNEARRLRECLESLRFCEQLVVADLGSSDASVEIATQCGAEIVHRRRAPIVEEIRQELTGHSRNDWVVFLDPDEVFPAGVEAKLRELIATRPNLAVIMMESQFYFRGKPLGCTFWGTLHKKGVVCHRRRTEFSSLVHRPLEPRPGYERLELPGATAHRLRHYWMDSYAQLFEKHRRYLRHEGQARHARGERFSWRRCGGSVGRALRMNLFAYGGWRGGWTGIFLSGFHAWYVGMGLLSLRRYERALRKA